MKKRPVGHFVGYGKFAVDQKWLADKRDLKNKIWHSLWFTVWRLKQERLWTDGAIKKWLGEPTKQGKYKVFTVEDVKRAERKKVFKEWLEKRIVKKKLINSHFKINKL